MIPAYIDPSFFLALVFNEPKAKQLASLLRRFDPLLSGDLFIAEVLSAATREKIDLDTIASAMNAVTIVLPDRSLSEEMHRALAHGYMRGADLSHVACALFVAGADVDSIAFLTRDAPQRNVARRLGFVTP